MSAHHSKRSIDLDIICVVLAWVGAVVLLAWGSHGGPPVAQDWALLTSAAAAAGTVVVAFLRAVERLGDRIVDADTAARATAVNRIVEALDEREDPLATEVAGEVVRRLELKEIEDSVTQLGPRRVNGER